MDDAAKIIDSLNNLIATLVDAFGVYFTIFLIVAIPIAVFQWKRYNAKQKDKIYDKLIAEKDETIKRMSEELRLYRSALLKDKGWTNEEIDRYINLK